LQGHQPFAAAVRAIHDTLKALREGTSPDKLEGIATDDMMKRWMCNEDYVRWTKEWL
jgi:carboxyvinyl-carboxyphosphonate phosphorylmutase